AHVLVPPRRAGGPDMIAGPPGGSYSWAAAASRKTANEGETCALLGRLRGLRRDEALVHALEPVAQDTRQVEEHLRGDPRVAVLDASKETLVDRQHLDAARGHDVRAPLVVAHETHFADHVAPAEPRDRPPPDAVAEEDVARPLDDDVHLVAAL